MKKWVCSVCGYVHTGDEPPEKCFAAEHVVGVAKGVDAKPAN